MAKPEAPVLETERLRLRRRQHRDIPRMMQAYQDDEIRRYLGGHPPKRRRDARPARPQAQPYRMGGDPAGGGPLYRGMHHQPGGRRLSRGARLSLPAGVLGERAMRREAAQAVLDYAAGKLRLGRMCACIDAANTRSVRLAERLGFERIAFLPEADFGGRVADMYYYARKLPGREWPLVP